MKIELLCECIMQGSDGIFSSVKDGSLLIDCSTVDPALSKQIACQVKADIKLRSEKEKCFTIDLLCNSGVNDT